MPAIRRRYQILRTFASACPLIGTAIEGDRMSLRTIIQGVVTVFVAALILIVPMVATAAPSQIEINPGNVPTTAAGFETQSCENLPDIGDNEDGWVFVLPSSAGAEGNFISLTATFEDSEGGIHNLNATNVSGSGDNKAFIVTPAGWTLTGAVATVEDPDEGAFFNLTHACAGVPEEPTTEEPTTEEPTTEEPTTEEPTTEEPTTEEPTTEEPTTEEPTTEEPTTEEPTTEEPTTEEPTTEEPTTEEPTTEEPTTPGEETTTPDEEPTTPDKEPTTPDKEETTPPMAEESTPPKQDETKAQEEESPQPDKLNQTGNDLTGILAAAAALVFVGLSALYLVRRRPNGTS